MRAPPEAPDVTDPTLAEQAARIRASGVLGKAGSLTRLFDYLLQRSLVGEAPKEIEIAIHAFGKPTDFDVGQDSVVRVYVHKLRRRLDDFYSRPENAGSLRVAIPKGEYRLVIETVTAEAVAIDPPPAPGKAPSWRRFVSYAASLLVAMVLGAIIAWSVLLDTPDTGLRAVRESAVWAPMLDDDLPITLVVGDYYLLGEEDEAGNIQRLVREFFINSQQDFVDHLSANPQLMQGYRHLDLTYLPAGSAAAMQNIAPVLGTGKPVRVLLASKLTGEILQSSHIVYVGYISGLGLLGDTMFAGSRLTLGGTYDELFDTKAQRAYMATGADKGNVRYVDYGYFTAFDGPRGNRIVIVAGTRDSGLITMAEQLTDTDYLRRSAQQMTGAQGFEGLSEVRGMDNANMSTNVIFVEPLTAPKL